MCKRGYTESALVNALSFSVFFYGVAGALTRASYFNIKKGDGKMNDLRIDYIEIGKIKPYKKNARKHPKASIDAIKESINDFGMCDPIAVWGEDNIIIEGHGRLKALKELGYKEIPVIHLDHLTDEQRRAYTLAHNATASFSEWDFDLLPDELSSIFDIDMSKWGFSFEEQDTEQEPVTEYEDEEIDDSYYGDERERTNKAYNLDLVDYDRLEKDFWQMPVIKNNGYIPEDLIGFNYAKTSEDKNVGIHFYVDDYQFERTWNAPEKYVEVLMEYDCILSPDFSLYMDMPMPMKIWNIYRSRFIGAYYQSKGLRVIPTISWAEKETFAFCFKGIPKGSIVSISTIGVKKDEEALQIWKDGVAEMIKQIEPSAILIYGGELEYDYGNIKTIYFNNKVTERWKSNDD